MDPEITAVELTVVNEGAVRGFLHRPVSPGTYGLVLTHGAGGNCNTLPVPAIAKGFAAAGFTVLRCDLPFRQKRAFGPPSPAGAAEDRAGLREACKYLRGLITGRLILGGHSYGGRQASMLAAEEPGLADALLLLSYPLHPPKKPEQMRTAHLPQLHTAAVFVHGSSDPFGSVPEMEQALGLIPAPVHLHVVDGAGHDLKRGRFDLTPIVARFGHYFAGAGGVSDTASVI